MISSDDLNSSGQSEWGFRVFHGAPCMFLLTINKLVVMMFDFIVTVIYEYFAVELS